MAQLRIAVNEDSTLSLYRWLIDDPDVRRYTTLSRADGQPGDMGGALDVINVVLSNTIAFSSLIVAVASWREARKNPPTVEIERNGVRVTINNASPEAVQRAIETLSAEHP
jgi:hypothetical protein